MRNLVLFSALFLVIFGVKAQNYPKPQFLNEVTLLVNNSPAKISKESAKSGLTGYMVYAYKIDVKGENSPYQFKADTVKEVKFLIKVSSQEINPKEYLNLTQFGIKKGVRRILTKAMVSAYHNNSSGNVELEVGTDVPYEIEKYENEFFLVTIPNIQPGEYSIYVAGKTDSIYTFGIH